MSKKSFYEKTLSEETIFTGRVFSLIRKTVRLPDGKTSTRDLIVHPGAAAMIPVDAKGNILMVRQFRKAAGREMIELPAGTLDPGESVRACVQRELQEEIGLKARSLKKLISYYPAAGYTTEIIHIYIARDLIPSRQDADHDEFLEVVPMRVEKILAGIRSGTINDSKTIIGMLYYRFLASPATLPPPRPRPRKA